MRDSRVVDLEAYRARRLETDASPLRCVHGEARPGLVVLHVPEGWTTVQMSPAKARIWLASLAQLIESAEALDPGGVPGG